MKRGISIVLVVIFILVVVSGCGDDGKIRVPKSASECKGKDYLDVKALFESAGFTNVNVRAIEDLVTGWITKDGSVERVSINGDDDFGSSSFPGLCTHGRCALRRIRFLQLPVLEQLRFAPPPTGRAHSRSHHQPLAV